MDGEGGSHIMWMFELLFGKACSFEHSLAQILRAFMSFKVSSSMFPFQPSLVVAFACDKWPSLTSFAL